MEATRFDNGLFENLVLQPENDRNFKKRNNKLKE